jgi:hypothetical protein
MPGGKTGIPLSPIIISPLKPRMLVQLRKQYLPVQKSASLFDP